MVMLVSYAWDGGGKKRVWVCNLGDRLRLEP